MLTLLVTVATFALRLPMAETFEDCEWKPTFTKAKELELADPTVAFFTHASRHFDPLCVTQPAVIRVADSMKAAGLPTVYLHDRYNSSNPAWMYLYRDWRPTAFVESDVGHIDLDFSSVRHVISLGGYFGQCQRSTVEDSIRCWRRDARDHDFRVTQIVDGIFCVCEYTRSTDPYYFPVRELFYDHLRKQHPKAVISIDLILGKIDDRDHSIDFLCRQVPPVPSDINVVIDFFGHSETVQMARRQDAATLTLAWRRSQDFLRFTPVSAERDNLTDRKLRRRSSAIGRRMTR